MQVAYEQLSVATMRHKARAMNAYMRAANLSHIPNRPDQKSFCCGACGFQTHADLNAAENIKRRAGDAALQACKNKGEVKALLLERHEAWKTRNGCP